MSATPSYGWYSQLHANASGYSVYKSAETGEPVKVTYVTHDPVQNPYFQGSDKHKTAKPVGLLSYFVKRIKGNCKSKYVEHF